MTLTLVRRPNGKLQRNASGKLTQAPCPCDCEPSVEIICLPRVPTTVWAHIVGDGGAACMDGDYELTWNDTLRRYEGLCLTCAEELTITLNELDCDGYALGGPCTPDDEIADFGGAPGDGAGCLSLCATRPEGACLVWSIRCASLGFVNAPTWIIDETHDPITGAVQHATNTCVSDDGSNPEIYVVINETAP